MPIPPLNLAVRNARLRLHLKQQEVAARIGCSQAAISYFENGNPSALANEKLEKLLDLLGLQAPLTDDGLPREAIEVLAFCPCDDCPLASGEVIRGQLVARPAMFRVTQGLYPNHCKACGSELSYGCDHCLSELVDGSSCCSGCGQPLVRVTPLLQADPEESAEKMRARAARYRENQAPIEPLPRPEPRNSGRRRPSLP